VQILYGVYDNFQLIRSDEITTVAVPGEGMYITMRKTVTERLGEPYNQCNSNVNEQNTSFSREIALMGSSYRQSLCFRICMLHYIETECACRTANQFDQNDTDTCSGPCVEAKMKGFDYQSKCAACPLECGSTVFDLKVDKEKVAESSVFNSIIQANFKNGGFNYSLVEIQNKLIVMKLNFESLSYSELKELPKMTYTNLVAQLGGTVGNGF
jgi:hypothetical protein